MSANRTQLTNNHGGRVQRDRGGGGECKPNERGECKPNEGVCANRTIADRVGCVTKNKTKKSLYILLTSGEELRDDLLSSRSRNSSSASGATSDVNVTRCSNVQLGHPLPPPPAPPPPTGASSAASAGRRRRRSMIICSSSEPGARCFARKRAPARASRRPSFADAPRREAPDASCARRIAAPLGRRDLRRRPPAACAVGRALGALAPQPRHPRAHAGAEPLRRTRLGERAEPPKPLAVAEPRRRHAIAELRLQQACRAVLAALQQREQPLAIGAGRRRRRGRRQLVVLVVLVVGHRRELHQLGRLGRQRAELAQRRVERCRRPCRSRAAALVCRGHH